MNFSCLWSRISPSIISSSLSQNISTQADWDLSNFILWGIVYTQEEWRNLQLNLARFGRTLFFLYSGFRLISGSFVFFPLFCVLMREEKKLRPRQSWCWNWEALGAVRKPSGIISVRLKFEINSVVLQDVVCGGSEASIVPVPTSFAAKSPVWRHTVL